MLRAEKWFFEHDNGSFSKIGFNPRRDCTRLQLPVQELLKIVMVGVFLNELQQFVALPSQAPVMWIPSPTPVSAFVATKSTISVQSLDLIVNVLGLDFQVD